jgi:energy-coupling factor transporter ATP-binding protein EcfA2
MLKSVTVKNFKLHTSTKIDAAPLTVLIGPNNSGKSSIFQALLLLRQSAMAGNVGVLVNPVPRQATDEDQPFLHDPRQQIDPGTFDDVVHSGAREIGFEIAGRLDDQDPRYGGRREANIVMAFRDNQTSYHKGTLLFDVSAEGGERTLTWAWARGPLAGAPQQSSVGLLGKNFLFSAFDFPQMLQSQGFTHPGGPPADPAQTAELSLLQNRIADVPLSLLRSVHPVYPLRGLEESGYPVTMGPEANIDRTMLADRTLALLSVLAYRNDVLDQVSNWLENLVQVKVRTKLVPPRRVTIICEPVGGKTRRSGLFSNEGTGPSQLPFILLPIALCASGETMMISEPEAHLHPRAQSELAGLFIRISSSERKQLLIETHSEHILNALLHAVAKGDLSKQDLAMYYFEPREGTVDVRRLEVDEYGGVEGGLPGFFDHSLSELSEYLETLQKKS